MRTTRYGQSDVQVSAVTFGPMRMDPASMSRAEGVRLLEHLARRGVNTIHSSYEYPTHEFFCSCLRDSTLSKGDIVHVVKLADPHFDETEFTCERMERLVDRALRDLNTEQVAIVQWLVRHTPLEDEPRLQVLRRAQDDLRDIWQRLKSKGKVRVLAAFPYTQAFAREVLDLEVCEGLVTYLNLAELEYASWLNDLSAAGRGFLAIRPLYAGILTPNGIAKTHSDPSLETHRRRVRAALDRLEVPREETDKFALRYCLMHDAVNSVIVGVSSIEHADRILDAEAEVDVDRSAFLRLTEDLRNG